MSTLADERRLEQLWEEHREAVDVTKVKMDRTAEVAANSTTRISTKADISNVGNKISNKKGNRHPRMADSKVVKEVDKADEMDSSKMGPETPSAVAAENLRRHQPLATIAESAGNLAIGPGSVGKEADSNKKKGALVQPNAEKMERRAPEKKAVQMCVQMQMRMVVTKIQTCLVKSYSKAW